MVHRRFAHPYVHVTVRRLDDVAEESDIFKFAGIRPDHNSFILISGERVQDFKTIGVQQRFAARQQGVLQTAFA
jgi:hypothetical protein